MQQAVLTVHPEESADLQEALELPEVQLLTGPPALQEALLPPGPLHTTPEVLQPEAL